MKIIPIYVKTLIILFVFLDENFKKIGALKLDNYEKKSYYSKT